MKNSSCTGNLLQKSTPLPTNNPHELPRVIFLALCHTKFQQTINEPLQRTKPIHPFCLKRKISRPYPSEVLLYKEYPHHKEFASGFTKIENPDSVIEK